MKAPDLKEKINIAWFRATGRNDGWEEFLTMHNDPNCTQADVARAFKVALGTSYRWHRQLRDIDHQAAYRG